AEYVAEDGSKKTPVMIHRAILGSLERFVGILIEHYAGSFPLWLAPEQIAVMGITDRHADYVQKVTQTLRSAGFRARADLRNEKIGFKIRELTLQRIPYLVVIGDREVEQRQISVRTRSGEDLGSMGLDDFITKLRVEVEQRR
ncbi:MAG: His/Gly/Thr/Pro-type tRNA ligase C-terminal domain-containing protein, partial [Gammaproteobacteria bacterium]|nr:His/Gly/Thr/Pro-type tRNA ligase C-terminal domain-containing protein [Gammaproteobacteria bacterium]